MAGHRWRDITVVYSHGESPWLPASSNEGGGETPGWDTRCHRHISQEKWEKCRYRGNWSVRGRGNTSLCFPRCAPYSHRHHTHTQTHTHTRTHMQYAHHSHISEATISQTPYQNYESQANMSTQRTDTKIQNTEAEHKLTRIGQAILQKWANHSKRYSIAGRNIWRKG